MARNLATNIQNEATAREASPFYAASLRYDSNPVHVWSGYGDLLFDGDGDGSDETFKGVGKLGSVSEVHEASEIRATSFDMQLSGVPSDTLDDALTVDYQNRICEVFFGFVDEDVQLVANPLTIFLGFINTQTIEDNGETSTISVRVTSRLADLKKPRIRRYTNEDQQQEFSSDDGLEFIGQVSEKKVFWGPDV